MGAIGSGTPVGTVKSEWSDLNTYEGDGNVCTRCEKAIDCPYEEINGRVFVDRSNRIDFDDDGVTLSQHAECYDLEVFGYITDITKKIIQRWRDKYS